MCKARVSVRVVNEKERERRAPKARESRGEDEAPRSSAAGARIEDRRDSIERT